MATTLWDIARRSVSSVMPAKSLELKHIIRLIRKLDAKIEEIKVAIQSVIDEIQPRIMTIIGMRFRMGPSSYQKYAILLALTHRIRFSHIPECHHSLTNPGRFPYPKIILA